MKIEILLITIFVAVTIAAPQKSDKDAQIISQDSNIEPDGSYQYSYETDNGIKGEETGTLKKASSPDTSDVIISQGSVSYTAPDGTLISLQYSADDENGFVPQGDHLPTPPPVPPAIQKALDYLLSLPPQRRRR
ncbi:endocuticle structural glycoprotein ABD-4-like [Condylostylus longicornis]|uniref:endocuticle structural glycoprotein ABD-4-like n=1 Tax=Condylostylus longicornis TaxID=2530218 RepID=UPI00244DD992|nr:endocuticle structural glycoprotein ABD-4-like [Condylostylus longicornis]